MLDEYAFSYGFSMLCEHKDPIVRDFALRIRDRKLFAYSESEPSNNRKLRHQLKKAGYNLDYYWSRMKCIRNHMSLIQIVEVMRFG